MLRLLVEPLLVIHGTIIPMIHKPIIGMIDEPVSVTVAVVLALAVV